MNDFEIGRAYSIIFEAFNLVGISFIQRHLAILVTMYFCMDDGKSL